MQSKKRLRAAGFLLYFLLFMAATVGAEEGENTPVSTHNINTDGSIEITAAGDYIIEGNGTQTDNTITVTLPETSNEVNITIRNIHIEVKGCPFNITKGTVNLKLEGKNILKGTGAKNAGDSYYCAALQLASNSILVITGDDDGKLTAEGGYYAAGIGGGKRGSGGNITINGGTVTATGGYEGAGIGGGSSGSGGNITINGGMIMATGGYEGAGIGGGNNGSGGTITIKGGTVTATGGGSGAGIGSGLYGSGGTITIQGGNVTATGGYDKGCRGAGISGGYNGSVEATTIIGGIINTSSIEGMSSKLSISGGTIVSQKGIYTYNSNATFEITGGSVRASNICSTTDGTGLAVIKLPTNAKVTSVKIGEREALELKDVYTDKDGLLYLYLPAITLISLSLTVEDENGTSTTYEAPYVITSEVYDDKKPGTNASGLRQKGSSSKLLSRNQNSGTIEMLDGNGNVIAWNDTPTVGETVTLEVKLKYGYFLNYTKLKGIVEEQLNVELVGKYTPNYSLVYHLSFTMPSNDVYISLFGNLLVTTDVKEGYEQNFWQLTIKKPGEYKLQGAFALLSDEEKGVMGWMEAKDQGITYSIVIDDNLSQQNGVSNEVVLHLDGVSIDSYGSALSCGANNHVRVVLDGDNRLGGAVYYAALNKGADEGTLTIEGVGRLDAQGGYGASGIGGNDNQPTNNITIQGGTIAASYVNRGYGGIAGASGSSNITITGGSVNGTVPSITDLKKTEIIFPAAYGGKVFKVEGFGVTEKDESYNLMDMILYPEINDGNNTVKLYLWLPESFSNKNININGYSGTVTAGGEAVTLSDNNVVEISSSTSYNESDHKNKSILIKKGQTFTVDAGVVNATDTATVYNLTIEADATLLTKTPLKVDGLFRVERTLPDGKWTAFCSPVALSLYDDKINASLSWNYYLLKGGYSAANDQKWTPTAKIKGNVPYMLAYNRPYGTGDRTTILDAQHVTLPAETPATTTTPDAFGNYLLFQANPSLTVQEVENIYVLEGVKKGEDGANGDNNSQQVVLKDKYELQPFEAYFIASPAMQAKFKRFSLSGEGSGEPVGIAGVLNGDFHISAADGTLLLDNRSEAAEVAVYNLAGNLLLRRPAFTGRERITHLPHGIYIVTYNRVGQKVVL